MYTVETPIHEPELKAKEYPWDNIRQEIMPAGNTIRLQLGSISCAIICPDAELYNRLKQVYRNFETEQLPDITIELEGTERLSPQKLETSVFKTKYISKAGKRSFMTSSGILSGRYDAARRLIKIKGERNLGNPDVKINHLNRLLTLAYYTACNLKYENIPPAMFVHSCSILRNGHGLLFTGPSGVGKTTIARFCGEQDGEVINDEMALLTRPGQGGNGSNVQSAPMLGTFRPNRELTAPLRCIFLLKQSNRTMAQALSKTEAYIRFMRQVISPACIGQKDKRTLYAMITDFSARIVGVVPVYELEFNLDGNALWQTVADIERTLNKKEGQ
jgi:hypothetical protein